MDSERGNWRSEFTGGAGPGGERNQGGHLSERGHLNEGGQGHRLGQDNRFEQDERLHGDEELGRVSAHERRQSGLRRVRHMSNWTAAALLAGTGVATVALANQVAQSGTTATTSGNSTHGTSVQPGAPHVRGSVVTSGGSGGTVTSTTKVVNGKPVVTKVRHPAVWHDN